MLRTVSTGLNLGSTIRDFLESIDSSQLWADDLSKTNRETGDLSLRRFSFWCWESPGGAPNPSSCASNLARPDFGIFRFFGKCKFLALAGGIWGPAGSAIDRHLL